MRAVILALCCHLLVMSAYAASIQSSSGDITVTVSGDLKKAGDQGRHCSLPQKTDVIITIGDITVTLTINKSPRVTQDAPVFIIGDDGKLRPEAGKSEETYALYHDTDNGAAMMITCPRAGEDQPLVEGTVLYQGRKHHLRQSRRRRRDVGMETNLQGGPEYQLSEVPDPKKPGPQYDAVYPPGVHKHSPKPLASRRGLNESDDLRPFEELELKDPEIDDDDDELDDIDGALGRILRRRRRQAVNGQNVFIDTIAVIAYDIYKKYYDASTETTDASKDSDAVTKIKKLYALLMSEADYNFQLIGSRLPYSISLRLAGYAIAKTAGASSWTEENKVSGSSRYLLESSTALANLRTWVKNLDSRLDYYVLFTEYDLTSNGRTSNAGIAYVQGVCSETSGYNVAVVEAGDFSAAVMHTLHEVGHGFGAQHDGSNNDCTAADSYIMEPGGAAITDANRANIGLFSECSLAYFAETFSELATTTAGQACMFQVKTPVEVPDVSGIIPGQLYDIDTQCKRALGDESYVCSSLVTLGDSMCSSTFCSRPGSGGSCTSISLLRGTTCGNKKWCQNALCVSSPDASSLDESCPFGDRVTPPYSNDARTCSQLVSEESGSCYSSYIKQQCCRSCAAAKGSTAGCEYGDRSTWCQASNCRFYTSTSLKQCCSTCSTEITTATTTSARAPTTTTTAAITTATTTAPATTAPTTTTTTTAATSTSSTTTPTTTAPTTTAPTTTAPTTTAPTTTAPTTTAPTTTAPTTTAPTTTAPTTTAPTTTAATTTAPTTTASTTTAPTTTAPTTTAATTTAPTTTAATTTAPITTAPTTTPTTTTTVPTTAEPTTTQPTTPEVITAESTTVAPVPTPTATTRTPSPTGDTSSTLAGQRVNGNEQCRLRDGESSSASACKRWMSGRRARLICSLGLACSSGSFCSRGDPALNGTTCGDKMWCINGACVESEDAPSADATCLFGDVPGKLFQGSPLTCADVATVEDGFCNYGSIRDMCCKSCGDLKKLNPGCPYGDMPGKPFKNSDLTCSELVTSHPGICFQSGVRRACCHSCR